MLSDAIPASGDFTPTDHSLSVRVLHSFADAESIRSAWNDLVLRSGADIYQTFDWCRLWWKYYGKRRQLHLLLCFSGEELVGLIPAFVETLWLGPARLRVAKMVGSDFTIQLCNLPVLSNAFPWVVSRAIHHFLGKQRCDLLLFGPLAGPASRLDALITVGAQQGDLVKRSQTLGDECNTFFHLPDSYDIYLKSIDKKQRSNIKRCGDKLSQAHRVICDTISSGPELEAEFTAFCRLHDSQWQSVGKLGHFGDWPNARDFNRELVCTLGEQGYVRFRRILADDRLICSQYSFVFGNKGYWRLPARVYGPEWDRFGLGALGLTKKIEALIEEGAKISESGRGHYPYKTHLGAREWPLRTVQFMRRGFGVSTRVRVFKTFAAVLNLIYYKVLFTRLAPRLQILRRPLWPLWIRSSW